jgi:hypothetical protein
MLKLVEVIFLVLLLSGCGNGGAVGTTASVPIPELKIYTAIPPTTAPPPTNSPTKTPWPEVSYGTVLVDYLNIRKGPGVEYPAIGGLKKGDEFFIVADTISANGQKWYLIPQQDNSFGCVIGEKGYVTVEKSAVDYSVYLNYESALKQARLVYGSKPTATADLGFIKPTSNSQEVNGCPYGCGSHKIGCDIKGNISFTTGEKIYHLPGDYYYNPTDINPEYGERWFCTIGEAVANGWRRTYK